MILGFKTQFPWGEPTFFPEKILSSAGVTDYKGMVIGTDKKVPKINSIREGKRWKAGDLIHMATGVRTKYYNQFNVDIPELMFVKSVQRIDVIQKEKSLVVYVDEQLLFSTISVYEKYSMDQFSKNDGFNDIDHFKKAFKSIYSKGIRNGQIIHWTDLKY